MKEMSFGAYDPSKHAAKMIREFREQSEYYARCAKLADRAETLFNEVLKRAQSCPDSIFFEVNEEWLQHEFCSDLGAPQGSEEDALKAFVGKWQKLYDADNKRMEVHRT